MSAAETPPDQHPRDSDPPSMGSVCEYLAQATRTPAAPGSARYNGAEFPNYVYMPCWLGWGQSFRRAGPYAAGWSSPPAGSPSPASP